MSMPFDPFKKPVQSEFDPIGPLPEGQSPAPQTSSLAVLSLVLGALSPVMLCACFTSLITSPVAIITGHLARRRIRASGGLVTGGGMALGGLILGYVSLALTVVALVGYVLHRNENVDQADRRSPGEQALIEVERKIATDSQGIAFGNTPRARELANQMATAMGFLDKLAFSQTKSKPKLSGGRYVTWCELRPDRCAFVIHVPEYRRFDAEAKKALEKMAWMTAQSTVAKELRPGDRLAVGLKGVLLIWRGDDRGDQGSQAEVGGSERPER